MEKNNIIIDIEELHKDYLLPRRRLFQKPSFVHAVQGVSFKLEKGLIYGLVGESGCGKSTLARMIAAVETPTRGRIRFNGMDLANYKKNGQRLEIARKIQLILQDAYAALPPNRTVKQILSEPLQIHKIGNETERFERIKKVLKTVHLPVSVLDRYHTELSAGVTQKINIARALMLDVELMLSDESISSLDPVSRIEIMNLFLELNKKNNLTIIFIAHDISTIKFLCEIVIVMYLGVCVEYATNKDIFSRPLHPYTIALMNAIPTIEKGLNRERLYVLEGEVPSPVELLPGCNFYTRCTHPDKDEKCRTTKPSLREIAKGHLVNCFKT